MKKLLSLLLLLTFANGFSQKFEKNWLKVYSHEFVGETKSASKEVDKIYKKARKQNNQEEIVKTFIYQSKYLKTLDEEAQAKILENLKSEFKVKNTATRSIFKYIYASFLNDYYHSNRYEISKRTNVKDSLSGDFTTWSKKQFDVIISQNFNESIEDEKILGATPLQNYSELLYISNEDKELNRSLYDYLIEQNLEYNLQFQNRNILTEEKQFLSKNIVAFFGSPEAFQQLQIEDNLDSKFFRTFQLYQKLEKNYALQNNQKALFSTVLKRMKKTHNLNKNVEIYQNALTEIASLNNPYKDHFDLEIAHIYVDRASETNLQYNKIALAILETLITKKENSLSSRALELKSEIERKNLSISSENFVMPNEPSRALINFKNVDTLYISYYKFPKSKILNRDRFSKDSIILKYVRNNLPYKTSIAVLPNKNDYLAHTTEILLPELELGSYLAFFTTSKDTTEKSLPYSFTFVNATNLTALSSSDNTKIKYQIADRKTGKPIENATVIHNKKSFLTDKNGLATFDISADKNSSYAKFYVFFEKDSLQDDYNGNYYRNYSEDREKTDSKSYAKMTVLTDRAIYRPGQKVFFKGILTRTMENQNATVPNIPMYVHLFNANNKEVSVTKATTNEFGSLSGEFILPTNILTGTFTIRISKNLDDKNEANYNKESDKFYFWDTIYSFISEPASFKVEEYKRPKFEINFEPVKENFVLNEMATVTGKAISFSGATVSNAKVKYTVENGNSSSYFKDSNIAPIVIDSTLTDGNGNFKISFNAIPPNEILESELPQFKFIITAEIIDISGETIIEKTEINVGYHSLILNVSMPKTINATQKAIVNLNSTNLNNQFMPTTGNLKIYKLESPDRVFKSRLFNEPDIQTIPKETFEKLFPHEPYDFDSETKKWKNADLVFEKAVNTNDQKEVILPLMSKWKSGKYRLLFIAKDVSGKDIVEGQIFTLVRNSDNVAFDNVLFTSSIKNTKPISDGFINLSLSSATQQLYPVVEAFYEGKSIYSEVISLHGKKEFYIPIDKKWVGKVFIQINFTWQNEAFNYEEELILDDESDDLQIETIHLRNKIEPGSKENWSFTVKGKSNLAAEVLATMYDLSLDQFAKPFWDKNLTFKNNREYFAIDKSKLGFGTNLSYFKNLYTNADYKFDQETDFNWFGFNFVHSNFESYEYGKFLKQKLAFSKSDFVLGTISDGFYSYEGAIILNTRTKKTITSDKKGKFKIEAKIGDKLVITFKNKEIKSIIITKKLININLILPDDSENLLHEEFEILLDGTQSKVAVESKIIGEGNLANDSQWRPGDSEMVFGLKSKGDSISFGTLSKKALVFNELRDVENKELGDLSSIKTRKNFSETAFFLPHLQTDTKGNLKFSFTSPESLTQWKLRILAHNKKATLGYFESAIITQKDFMVAPNLPRFLREKDSITIITKISNLTSEPKSGMALLQLFDATTMESIDVKMLNSNATKSFKIDAKGNTTVSWKIYVPEGLQGVQYKIVAKAGNFSDGEENILPVLTNNMLVTESIPVWVLENSTKEYTFENLKNNTSTTLRNQQLTFEYTSNPTWLAIQALPYLMEYEHECAEQTFARYYANALASEILNSNPKIAAVFESWKKSDKSVSKLQQNEELKSVLLAETPWIADAQSEEEKKKNLAILFDLQKMKDSQKAILEKLSKKQKPSGGFAWFDNGEESEYITRHIISGLGHLQQLSKNATGDFDQITKNGVSFLDLKFIENHKKTEAQNKSKKLIWPYPYNNLHYMQGVFI